jgi:hypothetical protein
MPPGGIWNHNLSKRAILDPCLRPRGHWDQPLLNIAFRIKQVDCVWNVMACAETRFRHWRNGRVQINRRERQFSRLLAVEVCASAVVMLVTPCSEVVWSVLATHSIRQFPLHFPSSASPCAITFQLDSNSETPLTSFGSSGWRRKY